MAKRNADGLFMKARHKFEHELVKRMVEASGNKMEAARRLGISYATLKTIVGRGRGELVDGPIDHLVDEVRVEVMRAIAGERPNFNHLLERIRTDVRREFVQSLRPLVGGLSADARDSSRRPSGASRRQSGATPPSSRRHSARMTREMLVTLLKKHDGDVAKVAAAEKRGVSSLYRTIRKTGIKLDDFRKSA